MSTPKRREDEGTRLAERRETKRPRRYKVILHNDDYTTMDFVVRVLVEHFAKSLAEATHIMLQVHHRGSGVAGVYPRDVAESKVEAVSAEAKAEGHPLKLSSEPE